jgi:hypothetical protein
VEFENISGTGIPLKRSIERSLFRMDARQIFGS